MKLGELLGEMDLPALRALARDKVQGAEEMGIGVLASALETTLRSFAHVHASCMTTEAPGFWILVSLLEAADCSLGRDEALTLARAECERFSTELDSLGLINESALLYSRVLSAARRSDLRLDSSETALLGVLRQELGLLQVDHFLLWHHSELRHFYSASTAAEDELSRFVDSGIVFQRQGLISLPEEVVPFVREVIGVGLNRNDARRLFAYLKSSDSHGGTGPNRREDKRNGGRTDL